MKRFFTILIAVISVIIAANSCACTIVDNSEVGIKFNKFSLTEQGKIESTNVTGYIFYNPVTTKVFTYPTFVQRVDYPAFSVTTKDAAVFSMDPLLAYQIDRSKATDIFTKYRKPLKDIEAGYMRTCIWDAYRITANNYTADELMASRAKFEDEVRMMLNSSLGEEGFDIQEFTSQIDPPASLRETINAKLAAIQSALKADNEVKEAEAKAKITIAKARGDGEAMKIQADAEAYYNRTVAASLNELLVRQYAIEKWNGELPTYNGGNMTPFINIK